MDPIIENRDDVGMIEHPELWPNWFLPVKRYCAGSPFPQLGLIADSFGPGNPIRLYLDVNLLKVTPKRLTEAKVRDYTDAQACVDDGWRVD